MPIYDPDSGTWGPGQDPDWRDTHGGFEDTPWGGGMDVWDRDFAAFPLDYTVPPIYEEGGFTGPMPNVPQGGGGGGGGGGGIPGYGGPTRPTYNIPNAPKFTAPQFTAPSFEDAMNSPGYQFRAAEGQRALQQAAAAKGLLRTGGTLKNLQAWGQNFAAQEYQNVYDRALSSFDRRYQGARDEFTPRFAAWQTMVPVHVRQGDQEFQRRWDMYTFPLQLQQARNQAVLQAGLG